MSHQQRIIKNLEVAKFRNKQIIPVGASEDAANGDDPVQVQCIRENGVVHRIEVHCHCGKTISLICEYDDNTG